MSELLTQEQISEWCGYSRRSDIERWLDRHNIPWRQGKDGRVCTTLEAVNRSLAKDMQREAVF